jgi:hypothetical protein
MYLGVAGLGGIRVPLRGASPVIVRNTSLLWVTDLMEIAWSQRFRGVVGVLMGVHLWCMICLFRGLGR